MTGKHFLCVHPRAGVLPSAQAIEQAEQKIYTLQHELQLLADLSATGRDAAGNQLSLESLSVALASYAERLGEIRALLLTGGGHE